MEIFSDDNSIADLLFAIRSKGARIWSEEGQLRYQAPKGALAAEEIQLLRQKKPEILAFLSRKSDSEVKGIRIAPRESQGPTPVTPNQLWRLRTLHSICSMRGVSVTRLSGRLDVDLLRQTIAQISWRHEALRTRFLFSGDEVLQEARFEPATLSVVDLSIIAESSRMAEARRIIDHHNRDKIDPTSDPLFLGTLIVLGETEFVLLIHCHDCVSDATSGGILLRDFWTLYVEGAKGMPSSLVPIPIQQSDFAVWLQKSASHWNTHHAGYWRDRLHGTPRARLFPGVQPPSNVENHIAIFQSQIGPEETAALRALSRKKKTSLGMVVMTAWTALMLKWCDTNDIVLSFLTSGRAHSEVRNSIGCFMSPLYLRIQIEAGDRLEDLLGRIGKEYGVAYEHHDFGRLLTQASELECLNNPIFNWLPREVLVDTTSVMTSANGGASFDDLKVLPFDYRPPPRYEVEWDLEPAFAFIEADEKIMVRVYYRADRVRESQIRALSENVTLFARLACEDFSAPVTSLSCA